MKYRIDTYTFDASAQTITFAPPITLRGLLLITNVTDDVVIYNFADPALGGTMAGAILTLVFDTSSMADSDDLQIWYDDAVASVAVTAASLPLPSGAATATLQGAGLPAALGAGGGVKVDGSGTALPVSAAALPLPSGAATATLQGGGLPAALGAGGGVKVDGSGTVLPVSASLTAKQNYGAYTALTVTNLQSLAASATAGWKSAVVDNRTTKAQDYHLSLKLPTANTAPASPAVVYVWIAPGIYDGANWVFADGGTATPPDGAEGTYTIAATTNNLKFLGALAYTTQQQIIQGSFCLSDAVGAAMPEGFVIIIINNSGAALATGCVVAVEAITGSLA